MVIFVGGRLFERNWDDVIILSSLASLFDLSLDSGWVTGSLFPKLCTTIQNILWSIII